MLQRVSTFKPLKNVKQITLLKKYSQNRHKKSVFYRKTIKCRSPTSSGTCKVITSFTSNFLSNS